LNPPVSEYDVFVPVYDAWAAKMTEDVDFYVELAREAGGPIVELAVGTGRVAIPVAEQSGKRVLGIDSSESMLAVARERAAAAGVDLELRLGDMRDLELEEPAALIYCPSRSLLHLPTWADRRRTFERVAASLRPGGRFAWNAFVFDHRVAVELDDTPDTIGGLAYRNHYFPADNRIEITLDSGETVRLWWVAKSEWEGLVDVSGLETEALYGWFDRRPFDEESRELVWIARKPA